MKILKDIRSKYPNEFVLFGIFVFLFVVMSILSPDKFLSITNLQTMLFQMPEFGLMALAMMIAVLTGGIMIKNILSVHNYYLVEVLLIIIMKGKKRKCNNNIIVHFFSDKETNQRNHPLTHFLLCQR